MDQRGYDRLPLRLCISFRLLGAPGSCIGGIKRLATSAPDH